MTEEQTYKFKAKIQAERFYNDTSNWGVFVFTTTDDIPEYQDYFSETFSDEETDGNAKLSTLVGNMQQLYVGNEYEVEAKLVFNSKYNSYQYQPIIIQSNIPKTILQQQKFLETLVTSNQAETILAAYPNIVEDVSKNKDDVDLDKLHGIGEKTWQKIKERIVDNYVISDVLVLLQPLGVTYKMIKKLLMGESNPQLLKTKLLDNPYIMLKVKGLGFKRVDELAVKLNPNIINSKARTYAFLDYFFKQEGQNNGHTWVNTHVLDNAVREYIPECKEIYFELIDSCKSDNDNSMLYYENDKVGLRKYHDNEMYVWQNFKDMEKYHIPFEVDAEYGISLTEEETGFTLTDEQKSVVCNALQYNLVLISGKAGTGKTTIGRAILNSYKKAGYSIAACALSAKAVQRIIEATGLQATTIHRLLGLNPHDPKEVKPITQDVLFVDECSMINCELFCRLLQAVSEKTRIICVGDNMQLPPIGYGNIFSNMLDFKEDFHIFELKTVVRQAQKSGILQDANLIRDGIFPIKEPQPKIVSGEMQDMIYLFKNDKEAMQDIAVQNYLSAVKEYGLDEVVILTPRKQNCTNSTFEINQRIQKELISDDVPFLNYGKKTFKQGCKVVQRVNDYNKGVFNGECGYITEINKEVVNGKKIDFFKVKFNLPDHSDNNEKIIEYTRDELEQLDLAYALTIHLAQGSDYKVAIVITDTSHYILLDSCLLYTAITRAKEKCALITDIKSFKASIVRNKNKIRQTWINELYLQKAGA